MSKPAKFNWLTTLRRLAKRKTLLDRRAHGALKRRAVDWPTCACGQLCKALPRDHAGGPLDGVLWARGVEFYSEVSAGRWKKALATFLRIEARTTLLLKQMAEADAA